MVVVVDIIIVARVNTEAFAAFVVTEIVFEIFFCEGKENNFFNDPTKNNTNKQSKYNKYNK